jgi:hypothetical protein
MVKYIEVQAADVHAEYEQSDGAVKMEVMDTETCDVETIVFPTVYEASLNRHMALVPEQMVEQFNRVFGWE